MTARGARTSAMRHVQLFTICVLIVVTACQRPSTGPPPASGLLLYDSGQVGWLSGSASDDIVELTRPGESVLIQTLRETGGALYLLGAERPTLRSTLFLAESPFKSWSSIWSGEAFTVAVSPDQKLLAFTRPDSGGGPPDYGPVVAGFDDGQIDALPGPTAGPHSSVTWRHGSKEITYDGIDGWIYTVDLAAGEYRRLFVGESPSWSPSGTTLAFRRGRDLWTYDRQGDEFKRVLNRYFWQTEPAGSIFWHASERYLAINVPTAATGKTKECLIVDRDSGDTHSIYRGYRWCGPWMP